MMSKFGEKTLVVFVASLPLLTSILVLISICLFVGCDKMKDDNQDDEYLMSKCPPELILRAQKILGKEIKAEWGLTYDWLPKTRVFRFYSPGGDIVVYANRGKEYYRLNCKEGIYHINEILKKYTFEKNDFNNNSKIESFLCLLVELNGNPRWFVGTKEFLKQQEKYFLSEWMLGTETNKDVFRQLCFDPTFVLDDDRWEIEFNVFTTAGSVEQWRVFGEFNSQRNINQIDRIKINELMKEGTFFYPYFG